jgi:hypothetical protein
MEQYYIGFGIVTFLVSLYICMRYILLEEIKDNKEFGKLPMSNGDMFFYIVLSTLGSIFVGILWPLAFMSSITFLIVKVITKRITNTD